MSHTGRPEDRIERLLAVAGHPRSNPHEAAVALEGARRIMVRFDLGKHYGLRVAAIGMQLASNKAAGSLAALPASMQEALRAFEQIRDME